MKVERVNKMRISCKFKTYVSWGIRKIYLKYKIQNFDIFYNEIEITKDHLWYETQKLDTYQVYETISDTDVLMWFSNLNTIELEEFCKKAILNKVYMDRKYAKKHINIFKAVKKIRDIHFEIELD